MCVCERERKRVGLCEYIHTFVCQHLGDQKRVFVPLGLKLQAFVSLPM